MVPRGVDRYGEGDPRWHADGAGGGGARDVWLNLAAPTSKVVRRGRRRVCEVVCERERDESRAGCKVELAPDAGAVPFGCADRDVEPVRDFPVGVTVSK